MCRHDYFIGTYAAFLKRLLFSVSDTADEVSELLVVNIEIAAIENDGPRSIEFGISGIDG